MKDNVRASMVNDLTRRVKYLCPDAPGQLRESISNIVGKYIPSGIPKGHYGYAVISRGEICTVFASPHELINTSRPNMPATVENLAALQQEIINCELIVWHCSEAAYRHFGFNPQFQWGLAANNSIAVISHQTVFD